jgi:hypothetical protein
MLKVMQFLFAFLVHVKDNINILIARFIPLDRPGPKMKRIISQLLPGVSFRSIPSPL